MRGMIRRNGAAQAAATRPISALISAALLLLAVVAGVGGVGGFSTLGSTSAKRTATVAAASTIAVPVTHDRRNAPALRTPGTHQHKDGWAPLHAPEVASDLPAVSWQQPTGLIDLPVEARPDVIALTIEVSHRGRAPPAGLRSA
jgi:hypothetical protein